MPANNEQNITETLEDTINQVLQETQKVVEDTREKVSNVSAGAYSLNMSLEVLPQDSITNTLQPITHTIQVITSKLEKILEIAEITLEYINTGDSITIVGKVAGNTINTWILAKGMNISKTIAQEVVKAAAKGKTPIGIIIFSSGSIISFFFAKEIEELFKDLYFNKGINSFKPLEQWLQKHFNFPAQPTCPQGSKMPDGRCAPSIQEFWQNLFFLSFLPKPSQAYQQALARSKELESQFKLASSSHIQSDIPLEYVSQSDIQEYHKIQIIIANEEKNYKAELESYEQELEYKSNIISYCLEHLNQIILPQITQNKDLQYNETITILSRNNQKIKTLSEEYIDSINMDSPFAYLRALLLCENIIILDEQENPTLNENNLFKHLGYKDDSSIIFSLDKQNLTDTYLQARKSLYKSISQIKQERVEQELQELQKQQEILEQSLQNLDSKQKESQLKELQTQQEKALRDKQRQEQQQVRLSKGNTQNLNNTNNNAYITKHSNLILESQDKSITIIFLDKLASKDLDKNISMSHLLHIHNNKIDIFTQDKTYIDIQSLLEDYQDYGITQDILNSPSTQIFFYSALLLGSSEIESNPFLFGELDKDNTIKQDTPSYHFSPKDEENNLGTLLIFLNASTLTLLNYSLIDSSLNIKLELTNKESKEKQDKAIIQREQKQHKEQLKPLSTAMLHPILEDNEIKCMHGGVVQLKSNLGKSIQDKNIPFILETDLLYSSIVGCPNPPISGGPCTQVALILPSSRGLKKHNEDYPIMQDLVSSGVFSDKGVPLICIPKANSYKINAPSPANAKHIDKEALKAQIEFHKPTLRLHYKEHKSQQDNLPITQFYLFDNLKEQESPFENLILDYQRDAQSISDKDLEKELLQSYPDKEYQHKQINLQFGVHQIHLVFIIPQSLPKLFKESYKNYEHKDYGIGKYKPLLDYSKDIKETKESTDSQEQSISITHTRVFLSPFKANKLNFTFALGLDDYLDKDNITELKIVIKGVYDGGE